MTLDAMQWHESITLRYGDEDFRRKSLARLAHRYVAGGRVLDMRCLTGRLAVDLAAEGRHVEALDGYPHAVEMANALARQRGIDRPIAKLWDLTDLVGHVGAARFDTVICLDLLNHVQDDQATVAEISRVLAEGGRLILSAPAFPGLLGARDRSLGHLRRYTKPGLRRLLADNGLDVRLIRAWNFTALPAYLLIERVFRRRVSDGLRYGREGWFGSWPNRVLSWWYTAIENRLRLPWGLSWFVIAQKRGQVRSR